MKKIEHDFWKSVEFEIYIHISSPLIDLIDIDRNSRPSSIIVDRSTSIDRQDNVDRRRSPFPLLA